MQSLLTWLIGSITRGTLAGVIILSVVTLCLAYPLLGWFYAALNLKSIRSVDRLPQSFSESTTKIAAVDFPRIQIIRETEGVPILGLTPIEEVYPFGKANQGNPNYKLHRKLLSRYRARFEPQSSKQEVQSADAAKAAYFAEILLVEVVLEWNTENEWRVLVDIGYQKAPSQWARLPWWHKEGIATSNELIRVEQHSVAPVIWTLSTPTTAEAVTAYLKDYFLVTVSDESVNKDYKTSREIALKPKDFERGVVHPLMRVLPADFGGVSVLPYVFLFNTANGPLQAMMLVLFLAALLVLAVRMFFLAAWPWLRLYCCRKKWPALFPLLDGTLCPYQAVQERAADPESVAEKTFARNQVGLYLLLQFEASVIYLGLLGTLLYLSLAIMQLRIHPSTAVMQSILATMGVTMAQAFLTTIVSSFLQRIMEWLREFTTSAEERVLIRVIDSV